MPSTRVDRPVVRSYNKEFVRNAIAWVKQGGHAIVWDSATRARLLMSAPRDGDLRDLGYWALLDLGKSSWRVSLSGPMRGLAFITVPTDCHDIVRGWCTRDSIHPKPQRTLRLDCLECGACCRSNEVILERTDIKRFASGGRAELSRMPWSRRRPDGKLVLRLLKSGDCKQLASDNKCAIYTLRPSACRDFPAGSECCLFAREAEMDVVDGARN